jgi:hypothetical protein
MGGIKMSRPTPETDAFAKTMYSRGVDSHHDGREALKHAKRLERERDEAREALKDWENAAAHVEADHPDERHCGCVPVLRKLLTDAQQELADEREAIVGWDNKWRCAVEMAARAEVERDEARKICRELNDLVAYGLGQSGEPWSIDAMRQAADAIQKAKGLEESK